MTTIVNLYSVSKPTQRKQQRRVWTLRWFDRDGVRRSDTIGEVGIMTRREAIRAQGDRQREFDQGQIKPERIRRMTLGEFRKYHESAYSSDMRPASMITCLNALDHAKDALSPGKQIAEIRPTDARRVKAHLHGKDLALATVHKVMRSLRAAFYRAERDGLVQGNPFARMKLGKAPAGAIRAFQRDEVQAMLEAAPDLWWQAFITVAVSTGLRCGELLHLTTRDVTRDDDCGSVTVQPHRPGRFSVGENDLPLLEFHVKDHESRTLPVSTHVLDLLDRLQLKSGGSLYYFLSLDRLRTIDAKRIAGTLRPCFEVVNNLRRDFIAIQQAAIPILARRRGVKVEKVDWPIGMIHDLRRTYGTEMAAAVDVLTLCRYMGHSDPKTTMQFYHHTKTETADRARLAADRICGVSDAQQTPVPISGVDASA